MTTRPRRWTTRVLVGLSVIACVVSFAAMRASGLWGASTTVAGTTLRADTVSSQAQPTCANVGGTLGLLGSARLTWSHVDTRYEYEWRLVRRSNGNITANGIVAPPGAAGSTVTLSITAGLFPPGLAGVDLDVVVTATLRGVPGWSAATSTTTPVRTVNLIVGLSMRCA